MEMEARRLRICFGHGRIAIGQCCCQGRFARVGRRGEGGVEHSYIQVQPSVCGKMRLISGGVHLLSHLPKLDMLGIDRRCRQQEVWRLLALQDLSRMRTGFALQSCWQCGHLVSQSAVLNLRCWRPFPKRIHQRACPRRLDSCGLRAWHLRRPPSVLVRLGLGHRFRLRPRMTGTRRSGVGCGSKQRRRSNVLARRGARWQGDSEWAGSGRRVRMTM
mmetsp:Transcript_49763/g.95121  ORF Transcript_49763/g.95121 Transcript_49763/m.95121 type:complete len:217 (-) Transcript_49763:2116-2766(-)